MDMVPSSTKPTRRKVAQAPTSSEPSSGNPVFQESKFSSSVTLFSIDNLNMGLSSSGAHEEPALRRSPRKRVKYEPGETMSLDIEDIRSGVSPLFALKDRLRERPTANEKGKEKMEPTVHRGVEKEELDVNTKKEESILLRFDSPLTSAPASPQSPLNAKASGSTARSPTKNKGKPKAIPTALATPHPAPEGWEEVYRTIKDMRSRFIAPVDTMGCDQAQFKETDPKNRRFATLVSLMLSSQTKDEVTDAAITKLRAAVGGTLSVESIINASPTIISEAIAKVGFWRRKTEYLKQTAEKLETSFDSDVPKTADELCSLPGVGPKMAFLTLQVAWDLNLGIGVDVHVHRITNRLGWHKKPTKSPEETRLNLQSWLPKELHRDINHMLVGFGQVVCLPVGPKCGDCLLRSKGICPSARVEVKGKKGKKRKVEESSVQVEQGVTKVEVEVEVEDN